MENINATTLKNATSALVKAYDNAPTEVKTLLKFNTSGPTMAPTESGLQAPWAVIGFIAPFLIFVSLVVGYIVYTKCRDPEPQEELYKLSNRNQKDAI